MLAAVDPILVFQIYKNVVDESTTSKIPIASRPKLRATLAVIPIYLAEELTGMYIDTESKSINIDTNPNSLASGEGSTVDQKALGSITTINLEALKDSIGLTILLALAEQLIDKVTSKEYEVTYMNGAVTVFGGLLHDFQFDQNANENLVKIKVQLARGTVKTKSTTVSEDPEALRLGTTGATPAANAPKFKPPPAGTSGGKSIISPKISLGAKG